MQRHPEADVVVHTNDDLAEILGSAITRREQLRCWPLSSVELIETADRERHVYKAQRLLTVEPALYSAAAGRTSLLPSCRVLTCDEQSSTMLLEHLGTPVPLDGMSEDDIVRLARDVIAAIGTLPTGLPHYVDVGDLDAWRAVVDWTIDGLSALIGDGRFQRCTSDDLALIGEWSRSPAVLTVIDGPTRLTCGDTKFDQVFRDDTGYRLVDWSAAAIAPPDLDLVMLLEDQGIDPLRHVDPAVYGIRWFLLLRWAAIAKLELIPDMPQMFDDWAADGVAKLRRAATRSVG